MGLFDKLWQDPNKDKTKEKSDKKPEVKVAKTNTTTTTKADSEFESFNKTATTTASTNIGATDEESREYFKKIYTERNQPGPDFQEFSNAELGLRSKPLTDEMRYTAAAAGILAMGVTKQNLIDSGNQYIKDADEKLEKFKLDIEKFHTETVGKMRNDYTALEGDNAEIERQMIELTNRKNKNLESMQALHQEIDSTENKLKGKASTFEAAHREHTSFIAETISKIEQYL